jgi:hypothetical protein
MVEPRIERVTAGSTYGLGAMWEMLRQGGNICACSALSGARVVCYTLRAIISFVIRATSNDRQLPVCNVLIEVRSYVSTRSQAHPCPKCCSGRHVTPRDLCSPTLTDRLLSPLLQIKIGRYAKCVPLRVCTDIRSAVATVHVSYKRLVQRAAQM